MLTNFEDMLQKVDEENILHAWEEMMQAVNILPEIVQLHKKVLSCKTYLSVMKTSQWKKKMKKTIQTILLVEHILFYNDQDFILEYV